MQKEIVGDYGLLYTWKGQDDKTMPILLAAHMDVVPAESWWGKNWRYPLFQGNIADGFIWGRGSRMLQFPDTPRAFCLVS